MNYHDTPSALRKRLIVAIELCVNECFYRRRFMLMWQDRGIDAAYADWLAGAPKRVPEFLPQVAQLIEEIKECRFRPYQG